VGHRGLSVATRKQVRCRRSVDQSVLEPDATVSNKQRV
jgi:hypothetical protein